MKYSWDRQFRYGVSERNALSHQGEALADACGYWPVNDTTATRTIIAYQPIFISWLTPSDDEARQSWRLSTITNVVVGIALGWPLAMATMIVITRKFNYCGQHADEHSHNANTVTNGANNGDQATELLIVGMTDSVVHP